MRPGTTSVPLRSNKVATAGAIAGGVIGSLACLAIIGIVYWFYLRRPRNRRRTLNLLSPADNAPIPPHNEAHDKISPTVFNSPLTPPPVHVPTSTAPLSIPIAPIGVYDYRGRLDNQSQLYVANPDSPKSVDSPRSTRRADIKKQVALMQKEINVLTVDLKSRTNGSSSRKEQRRQDTSISELREQIRLLNEEVAFLQAQQSSSWAQGLSNEPLPGYSPGSKTKSIFNFSNNVVPDTRLKS
ncbi:hypothetical protein AN958_00668 [Leucoagaricus sp. SymC.cos]|nr:hypothetical protein AN958_00668 [Leucoagaricus sp. SymC.cos]